MSRPFPNPRAPLTGGALLLALGVIAGCPWPTPVPPAPAPGAVEIRVPESMFVGSYDYFRVQIDPASGVTLDDLDFELPDGVAAGSVSRSKDATFDPLKPTVMFGAGYAPGPHELIVKHRPSGTVVAGAKFQITDTWTNPKEGPSFWFSGAAGEPAPLSATWGGGQSTPQNINVAPASGTRRVALILVDTSSQRYTTDATALQAIRDRWENEADSGVPSGGVTRSARLFLEEVSYGKLTITADVIGPVQLPNAWTSYFTVNTGGNSDPSGSFWQSAITAADSSIDYRNYDSIVFVMQEETNTTPTSYAWAWANGGTFTTAEGSINRRVVVMPSFWGTTAFSTQRGGDSRKAHETLVHELTHNLGLGDQYTPAVTGRNLDSWDYMAFEGGLPHLTAASRMLLGWIPASSVRTFNFAGSGTPIDQTVTLHPVELATPPAGRSSVIEVRIADGWNYYFEYRVGQTTQLGDRSLPANSRVLGTDVVSSNFTAPISRPVTLRLPDDPDGDGAVLGNGLDYEERDNSNPLFPKDLQVDVSGIDGTKADVRIRYGANSRPDPWIAPWPASPSRPWQSPDIEVRNARNQADPAWANVPWEANPNTVVAKVKNSGNLPASNVRVNFYVKDYTVGGAPEMFIGSDVKTIPTGNVPVEFSAPWTPPAQGHYCVVVRIPLLVVPGTNPPVIELSELNNVAQSNYDRFISRTASPPSRETTMVKVSNPYDRPTIVELKPGQDNPLYRTYVEHTWLRLEPKETREVRVMFEFAGEDFARGLLTTAKQDTLRDYEKLRDVPNRFSLRALVGDPRAKEPHFLETMGGLDAEVVQGKASQFTHFRADDLKGATSVEGAVVSAGGPAPDGQVIFTLSSGGEKATLTNVTLPVKAGRFNGRFEQTGWDTIRAYYLPPPGTADATSPPVQSGKPYEAKGSSEGATGTPAP